MTFWRNRRLLAAIAVVLAVAAMAFWPETTAVDAARVERGRLTVTVDEEGETRVRDRFVVSAPVAGRLERVELEPGDPVTAGNTVVATLRPSPPALLDARTRAELTAAVASAQSAVGAAKAERGRLAAELQRARDARARADQLREAGLLSAEEYEVRQTAVQAGEEALAAAEFAVNRTVHELEMARARLSGAAGSGEPILIHSPIDGVVLRRARESEGMVPAGEPLIEVGDTDRIEIVADFLSSEAVRIEAGDPVVIEQWGGGEPLAGTVRRVEPSGFLKVSALGVEEQRVNVIIDFGDPAAARPLGDGYRVEVRVVVWEGHDVVKVPVGALFRREGEWAVFVVNGGNAEVRTIRIDHRNELEAEVLEGLQPGDRAVLHPPDTLEAGSGVEVRE